MTERDSARQLRLSVWNPDPDMPGMLARQIRAGDLVVLLGHCESAQARRAIRTGEYSRAERRRAERHMVARQRDEFLFARLMVRSLGAALFSCSAAALEIEAGPAGKPHLLAPRGDCRLDFSISHSAGWVACGFACGCAVGVDVELPSPRQVDLDEIASLVFSRDELHALRDLPGERRQSFLYEGWRRKEAVLKAAGCGFSADPQALSVFSAQPGSLPGLIDPVRFQERNWRLASLDHGNGVAIAVSWETSGG